MGRQPWVVYKVMRTEDAVTGASGIPVGFAASGSSTWAWPAIALVMLRRFARQPLEVER